MAAEQIETDAAPLPGGPYSQAMVAGSFVFIAGQGPFEPGSGAKVEGTFAEQAHQTFRNLAAVAEAAGGSLEKAVRIGAFLKDMGDFPEMNEIYRQYFSDPLPTRTTVQSDLPGFSIEVDAVLYLG